MSRPTIGIALIVKNEETNLARLIPELVNLADLEGTRIFDQVVVVDTGSTDASVAVAQAAGAQVAHFPWCDDFSAARTFAFDQLTTDWLGWLDADDTVENFAMIRALIENAEASTPQPAALWLLYDYDQIKLSETVSQTTAYHRRERFVRRDRGWHWVRPVHEHLLSDQVGPGPEQYKMVNNDQVVVHHNRDAARDPERTARNLRILHAYLKNHPKDFRTWFDLGSQYYFGQKPARALACYRKATQQQCHPIEQYQAWHRMADCYRQLNRLDQAKDYDWRCVQLAPELADAWFGLGDVYFGLSQFAVALDFIAHGRAGQKPPDMLVLNPLDYSYHPLVTEQRCLAAVGKVDEALAVAKQALEIIPGQAELVYARDLYQGILNDIAVATSVYAVADQLPEQALTLYQSLPERIQKQKDVRDKLLKTVYVQEQRIPEITIVCGPSLEDWGPLSPERTGIGGSETAVINVAQCLGNLGLNVDVYNQCGSQEGQYGNVRYLDYTRYQDQPTGILVSWRATILGVQLHQPKIKWLWLHDLHAGPGFTESLANGYDLIRPVSQWHAQHVAALYPFLKDKILPTRNGIDLSRFAEPRERHPHQAIYVSSPDRGLEHLLAMWPQIKHNVPDAELLVCYGWESFDKTIQQTRSLALLQQKNRLLGLLNQPGVIFKGRLTHPALATALLESAVLAYPTHHLETSMISSMEAMAAGTVILSSYGGAIPETTGDASLLLRGYPTSEAYQQTYMRALASLLVKPDETQKYRDRGFARAQHFSWQGVADEWATHLDSPTATSG